MSSTLTETITEIQQASKFIFDLLTENKERLGIGFLGLDERLRPEYPAVIVISGARQKAPHNTHLMLVGMEVVIEVNHANLNASHSRRTEEDLELVTSIENLLETDMSFGDRIVFAYVSQTLPNTARRPTGDAVIQTQMVVTIESRKGFPYAP